MKLSTLFNRLLSNKLNRSINRYEREREMQRQQAAYDKMRHAFTAWANEQPEDHPFVNKVGRELEKVTNNLTLSDAVKMKRYNAIFANAWAAVESGE